MGKNEALRIALPAIKTHPMANLVDLTKPEAVSSNGEEFMIELRRNHPNLELKFEVIEDVWFVSCPLFEEDSVGRTELRVQVSPKTGTAEIVIDL